MNKSLSKITLLVTLLIGSNLQAQNPAEELYRDLDEVYENLKQIEQKYPNIVKLITYGESEGSHRNRVPSSPLLALKISDNVELDEAEPNFMFTATTHGDEKVTTEALLRYLKRLLTAYESGQVKAKKLIDQNELFFIPIVNPYGYQIHTRFTARRVDPNRSFPYVNAPGVNRNSARCIDELVDFYHTRNFNGIIDFHAQGELILLPFADSFNRIPTYQNLFRVANLMNPGNYQVFQNSHYNNIGIKKGSSIDYWNSNGTNAFTIELARSKTPFSNERIEQVTDEAQHIIETFTENIF